MDINQFMDNIIKNEPKGRGNNSEDQRRSYYRTHIANLARDLQKAISQSPAASGKSPVETDEFLVSKGNTFTNVRLTLMKMYMDGGMDPTEDRFEEHFDLVVKPMLELHEEIKKAAAKPKTEAKVSKIIT